MTYSQCPMTKEIPNGKRRKEYLRRNISLNSCISCRRSGATPWLPATALWPPASTPQPQSRSRAASISFLSLPSCRCRCGYGSPFLTRPHRLQVIRAYARTRLHQLRDQRKRHRRMRHLLGKRNDSLRKSRRSFGQVENPLVLLGLFLGFGVLVIHCVIGHCVIASFRCRFLARRRKQPDQAQRRGAGQQGAQPERKGPAEAHPVPFIQLEPEDAEDQARR
jgi:hypothetical protein